MAAWQSWDVDRAVVAFAAVLYSDDVDELGVARPKISFSNGPNETAASAETVVISEGNDHTWDHRNLYIALATRLADHLTSPGSR